MNVELHRALVLKIKENRDAARGDIFAKARLLYTTANVKKSCKMRQTWKTCQACLGISLADLKSNLTSRTPCHGARDALENPPKEFYCNPNFANTLTVREKLARIHSKKGERDGGQRFANARSIYNSQASPVMMIHADIQSRQRNE